MIGTETTVVISSLFVIPWSGREPLGLTRKTQAPALLLHEYIGDADNGLVRLLSESSAFRIASEPRVPAERHTVLHDGPAASSRPADGAFRDSQKTGGQSGGSEIASASPIVLYGPSGCGKTHLSWLLAANVGADAGSKGGSDALSRGSCWISGVEFVKQVSTAIDADAVSDLRQRLRCAPALFIDGLERITTRASAQDELRWLLDDCRQRSIPVLVTCNSLPLEVPELCPQIASRLHAGLVVPLGPPGAAARQQLVRELLAKAGVDLPPRLAGRLLQRLVPDGFHATDGESTPSALAPLAGRRDRRNAATALSPTVPALQEMVAELAKIHLIQQLTPGRGRTRDVAEPTDLATQSLQCVEAFVDKWSRQNAVSLKQVSQAVADYFGIRPVELKGPSRRQMVLRARGVAIYLGRHLAGESLDRLGAHFGGRDHSTALHAVRKTEELIAEDPTLRKAVDDLERQLRSDGES